VKVNNYKLQQNGFGSYDFSRPIDKESENYFWVDNQPLSNTFGQVLPPRLADLADLSMAVYYADRRTKRKEYSFKETGQRTIKITLPIRDMEVWTDQKCNDELSSLLYWLTEDRWQITFKQLNNHKIEAKQYLFNTPVKQPNKTVLFSGGLDSLAGLCTLMDQNPDCSFILFSGITNNNVFGVQKEIKRRLLHYHYKNSESREIRSVEVPFGIRKLKTDQPEEKSQRSRGFVFISLGAITAILAESSELCVNENGIGAINLPYNEGQLGIDNTRGSHPLTLIRISQFLNLVLEKELKVINPFQFWTKGKMCRSLNKPGLDTLAGMTISCDSFPLRIPVSHQCGTCTSCLLRRLSLFSAGLGVKDQASAYQHDVFNLKSFKSYDEKRKKLYPFLAMSDQANKIESCLNSPLPWLALMGVFPELREIQESISKDTNQNQEKIAELILELYHEYIREWKGFYNYLDKREIFSCSSMC
jgi:hypothetical protein